MTTLSRRRVRGAVPAVLGQSRSVVVEVVWLLGLLLGWSPLAEGAAPHLRLERLDARRCASAGTVQAHVAEVTLDGVLVRRPPSEYRLVSADSVLAERPRGATAFAASAGQLALALVVQQTSAYEGALPQIKAGLRQLARSLPATSLTTLVAYDWEARRLAVRASPAKLELALDLLASSDSRIEPALVPALRLALDALEATKKVERRVLVVISDGLDQTPDHDRFLAVGRRALRHRIPIFPLAFSPIDERGPLLNLGELAKRSVGTLRWARTADQIEEELRRLSRELLEQSVLTYKVSNCAALQRTPLRLVAGALHSNEVGAWGLSATGSQGGPPKAVDQARRWLPYLLFALVLLAALSGLLWAAAWVLRGLPGLQRRPGRRRTKNGPRSDSSAR